jgi:DNA-binding LacI/PurR family transcriptional regulator
VGIDVRIAVASASLGSGFAGLVYSHFKKHLKPGEAIVDCAVPSRANPDFVHSRLVQLLEGGPTPIALVGICLRPDPPALRAFRSAGAPVILVDEEAEGASTIACDNFAGGHLAGEHLASTGRTSIAVVSGEMTINGGYNALQRVKGFSKACAERGLPFRMEDVVEVVFYTHKDGVNAMTRLLQERRRIDAVFCAAGDATATGMMAVARQNKIGIPEQLAILGYDDSPMAAIANPPLSTIRQSAEQFAAEAYRLATTCREECLASPQTVLFPPSLVLRQTA